MSDDCVCCRRLLEKNEDVFCGYCERDLSVFEKGVLRSLADHLMHNENLSDGLRDITDSLEGIKKELDNLESAGELEESKEKGD